MARLELQITTVPCKGANSEHLLREPIPVTLHRQFDSDTEHTSTANIEVACPFLRKIRGLTENDDQFLCFTGLPDHHSKKFVVEELNELDHPATPGAYYSSLKFVRQNLSPCIQKNPQ